MSLSDFDILFTGSVHCIESKVNYERLSWQVAFVELKEVAVKAHASAGTTGK